MEAGGGGEEGEQDDERPVGGLGAEGRGVGGVKVARERALGEVAGGGQGVSGVGSGGEVGGGEEGWVSGMRWERSGAPGAARGEPEKEACPAAKRATGVSRQDCSARKS